MVNSFIFTWKNTVLSVLELRYEHCNTFFLSSSPWKGSPGKELGWPLGPEGEEHDSADPGVARAVYYLLDMFDSLVFAERPPEVTEVLRCEGAPWSYGRVGCTRSAMERVRIAFNQLLQI